MKGSKSSDSFEVSKHNFKFSLRKVYYSEELKFHSHLLVIATEFLVITRNGLVSLKI